MQSKAFKLMDLGSIPLWMDASFVLLALLWLSGLLQSPVPMQPPSMQSIAIGLVVFFGLVLSILLHELFHSLMAAYLGVGTDYVEFTGLGGLVQYDRQLPEEPLRRIAIALAGPVANLAIWFVLRDVQEISFVKENWLERGVCSWLALMNLAMLIFNLLPSYPLDGGVALATALKPFTGWTWAVRVVGWLGMVVVALCIYAAIQSGLWMLILAFSLFMANREQLVRAGSWPLKS